MGQNSVNENQFDDYVDSFDPELEMGTQPSNGGQTIVSVYRDAGGAVKALRVDDIKNKKTDKNEKHTVQYFQVTEDV